MRKHLPDSPIGLTIVLMWVGLLVLAFAAYWLFRWWRQRHPLPKPKPEPVQSYTQRLQQRMNKQRTGAAPSDAEKPGKHDKH